MEEVQRAGKPVLEISGYDHSVQSVSTSGTSQRTSVTLMEVDHSTVNIILIYIIIVVVYNRKYRNLGYRMWNEIHYLPA